MFCIKCGNQIPEESTFCQKCGAQQSDITLQHTHSQPHNSVLEQEFKNQPSYQPPTATSQVTAASVNNVLVWILAFTPLIGVTFAFGFFAFLVANIILCYVDENNLKKAGYDTSYIGNTWLVPTYLYKRAKYFGHSLGYFIVWCVTFGICILSDFFWYW
jgi:hypothetical protein